MTDATALAKTIVDKIIGDITVRRAFNREWIRFPADVRAEIEHTWRYLVEDAVAETVDALNELEQKIEELQS